MTHRLSTNYVKNYCNRTLIVKVIIENVVTCFFGTPCSLRCDEKVARISAAAASPPRPRTSSAPDSPSRYYFIIPVGESQRRTPPPAFGVWPHALSHMSSRAPSRAPSQMPGLDVAGLLNRLVDRQHDDLQQAVQQA